MRIYLIIAGIALFVGVVGFLLAPKDTEAPSAESGTPIVINREEDEQDVITDSDIEKIGDAAVPQSSPDTSAPAPKTSAPAPKPAPAPAPKPAVPLYGALVQFTDTGFKPKTVTITEGQVVRFLNSSSDRQMWVASAIHPRHDNYQEKSPDDCAGSTFDECEAVDVGEYWDFKFNVVGLWGYHNHVAAQYDGTVVVLESD